MQKRLSIIQILLFTLISISPTFCLDETRFLAQADSLFDKKKFAEAKELYQQLYDEGYYTPSTLLKMAFVSEGLSQNAKALFYLNAYYQATEDQKAYDKIQVLANAQLLTGYEVSDFNKIIIWFSNRSSYIIILCSIGILICTGLMLYSKKKKFTNGKLASGFVSLVFIGLIFFTGNFLSYPASAVVAKQTYFMSGPSAGASLLGMINDGHQISLAGETDIWAKVNWRGKEGFIKKMDLLQYQ